MRTRRSRRHRPRAGPRRSRRFHNSRTGAAGTTAGRRARPPGPASTAPSPRRRRGRAEVGARRRRAAGAMLALLAKSLAPPVEGVAYRRFERDRGLPTARRRQAGVRAAERGGLVRPHPRGIVLLTYLHPGLAPEQVDQLGDRPAAAAAHVVGTGLDRNTASRPVSSASATWRASVLST